MNALETIQTSVSAVTGQDPGPLSDEQRLFDDLGLDSTSVIDLVMQLEDTAEIEIDPADLTGEIFNNVGTLRAYIEEHSIQEQK